MNYELKNVIEHCRIKKSGYHNLSYYVLDEDIIREFRKKLKWEDVCRFSKLSEKIVLGEMRQPQFTDHSTIPY